MTNNDKESFEVAEFEKLSMTDRTLYQGSNCYILHESS